MKIIWYRVSSKCSDNWTDETSQEYVNRPFHLIREKDNQCMACLKTPEDIKKWTKEYQERLGKDWKVIEQSDDKCRLCGALINEATDRTWCGYGKCVRCCGGCLHRIHYNPNYIEPEKPKTST